MNQSHSGQGTNTNSCEHIWQKQDVN